MPLSFSDTFGIFRQLLPFPSGFGYIESFTNKKMRIGTLRRNF